MSIKLRYYRKYLSDLWLKIIVPEFRRKSSTFVVLYYQRSFFIDGNKRIASFLFIYLLDKNNYLFRAIGEKKINDNALTALAMLVAISNPNEKDKLIKIITNLISS